MCCITVYIYIACTVNIIIEYEKKFENKGSKEAGEDHCYLKYEVDLYCTKTNNWTESSLFLCCIYNNNYFYKYLLKSKLM